MHSLHISTDFCYTFLYLLYYTFGTVPFEPRFMSQSLCKCDRSLSQESVRKDPYFECFLGISEKSCKEICIACLKSML